MRKGMIVVKKVVTFGEIMMRLNPPNHRRFAQTDVFEVTYGGAESNVAALLAQLGVDAYFVSKIPDNPIGEAAIKHLKKHGVRTDYVLKGGERLGIYFLEIGAAQRPSKVVYDRKYSAISKADPEEFDWERILKGASWFHFSGITPALGKNLQIAVKNALKTAKNLGVKVSCDLNYRAKLWSTEEAQEVMSGYMEYIDLLIGNEEDYEKSLGIKTEGLDTSSGKINREAYIKVGKEIEEKFGIKSIAFTLRESISASLNLWSGLLIESSMAHFSRKYEIQIVDRVGAGDSFSGGLIYATLSGMEPQDKIEFAVAASALKHTIPGDFSVISLEEIKKLSSGNISGRVER